MSPDRTARYAEPGDDWTDADERAEREEEARVRAQYEGWECPTCGQPSGYGDPDCPAGRCGFARHERVKAEGKALARGEHLDGVEW